MGMGNNVVMYLTLNNENETLNCILDKAIGNTHGCDKQRAHSFSVDLCV